jgi:hypothetical protein
MSAAELERRAAGERAKARLKWAEDRFHRVRSAVDMFESFSPCFRRLDLRPGAPQLTSLRTTLPTGCAPLGSARAPRLTALRAGPRTGLHIWLGRPSRLGSGLLGLSLGYDQRGGGHRDAQRCHQSKKGKRLSPRDRFRLHLFTHVRPLKPLNRFMNRNNLQCERRAVSDLDQRAKLQVGVHPLGWTGVSPFKWQPAGRVPLQT